MSNTAPTIVPTAAADEEALFAKISGRLLPFLFLLYIVSYLDRTNISFAALQMREDLAKNGLNAEVFGFGGGIFFFGYFLFEIPSNLILQRVGARRWIARIMFTWGIVASLTMFVRGPQSFYVVRVLLGLAEAGFFPGMILYLTYWYPAPRRARAVALFMTATAISGVVGSLLSTAIFSLDGVAHLRGWQWIFLLEGIPAVLMAFVVLRFLPDGPQDARWLSESERNLLADILSRDHDQSGHQISDLLASLLHPRVWLFTAIYFCLSFGLYFVSLWLPQMIKDAWPGHADWQVTLISAIPYSVAAIGMVIVSQHSDRTGERRFHTSAAYAVAAIGAALSALTHNPLVALIAFSIVALGIWSAMGPFWAIPSAFLAGTAAAGGIAFINSVGNLGGWAGPSLVGAIKQHTGSFTAALWMLSGFMALGAVLVLLVQTKATSMAKPLVILALLLIPASAASAADVSITKAPFGTTKDNQSAELYTLTSPKGLVAKISTYGALLVELDVPDRDGKLANIVQGFSNVTDYEKKGGVNGATIGRYANRIANARFSIDGQTYNVTRNSGPNLIHGGNKGFHKVMWKGQPRHTDKEVSVELTYRSPDGEEGFPGNLDATVTYTVTADNELRIDYAAKTDKPTVVNLTNHSYFNLPGANSGPIDEHVLTINADNYTPAINGIPTGEIKPVKGTPLDFTSPAAIGPRLAQLKAIFDHNYVINGGGQGKLVLAARVQEPTSGRAMEVWTTYPGVQFYTGNGRAICLETEYFPDSPNHPEFPSPIIRPGQVWSQTTEFRFK